MGTYDRLASPDARALERINEERNALAHGRTGYRTARDIRDDLIRFVALEEWRELASRVGPPPQELAPWTARESEEVGVLESWSAGSVRYVIPYSGRRFTRQSSGSV